MKEILKQAIGKYDERVFYPLLLAVSGVTAFIIIDKKKFQSVFDLFTGWLVSNCAWFFQSVAFCCILFGFWLAFSRHGNLKLGKDDDEPEFSKLAWIAMMFSAGFGITMWMWCSTEIVYHLYSSSLVIDAGQVGRPEGVPLAMNSVYMDWCLHGWMLYAVGGFAVAFPAYRLGRPMNLAGGLYGIMGERSYRSWFGKLTDIAGVIAALGGTAAALGFGLMLITSGIKDLLGIEIGFPGKVVAMILLVVMFVSSAVSGLKRGIRILSLINIYMSALLCFYLLIVGPTNYTLTLITESCGMYLKNFAQLSLWGDAGHFADGCWQSRGWNNWWLVFYILWWASYIPFCGGFIARISRGRTVREYILGAVLIPSAITIVFFGIWSGVAVNIELSGAAPLWDTIQNDFGAAIFVVLNQYPLATYTCVFVFLSSILYGITTYDSTTYFISMQVSGGDADPKIGMRIIWGVVIGLLGLVALSIGGFDAIKALTVVCGVPFFIVLIAYMVSIFRMIKMAEKGEI